MIFPSVDLMNGKVVQLEKGKKKILEFDDPVRFARRFAKYGQIQLIDLDAALGKGDNLKVIKEICKIAECRVGGGIRSIEKAKELLNNGAEKIIIGTKANKGFLKQLPKERLIVAIDSKKGKIVSKGWTHITEKTPFELVKELENYCSEFLYTAVDMEGMMKGTDLDTLLRLRKSTNNKLTAAGGITTIEEIKVLEKNNINSVLGMSLYQGKIDLDKAFSIIKKQK